ncbi:MAG TPA: ATP-dependent Clp protease adaptor ClpS [Sphingobacteriaceae bacterium]|nr:ATP-dependent Clp protease adaptor ClpS [Sphingobacteriaceae bacterium]
MTVETQEQTFTLEEILAELTPKYKLILWNDDTNTFEHVIHCLVKHLQYSEHEAERIAWTVHQDGKAIVLEGTFNDLEIYRKILKSEGLTVSIE